MWWSLSRIRTLSWLSLSHPLHTHKKNQAWQVPDIVVLKLLIILYILKSISDRIFAATGFCILPDPHSKNKNFYYFFFMICIVFEIKIRKILRAWIAGRMWLLKYIRPFKCQLNFKKCNALSTNSTKSSPVAACRLHVRDLLFSARKNTPDLHIANLPLQKLSDR